MKPALSCLLLSALLLTACTPAASTETPAATPAAQSAAAPEPSPTPAPDPTMTPAPSLAPDPDALDYDEMRNVALWQSVPSTILEGYFTVSRDGKWGLIRADGTELLPCLAETPVRNCGAHWIWDVPDMSWDEIDAYTAELEAQGEPGLCGGHGGSEIFFVYDLDVPGLDNTALDTKGYKAYIAGDGPRSLMDITDEMWDAYGDLLPAYSVHEVGGNGDPVYPSEPVVSMRGDGVQVIYQYISREGWGLLPAEVQTAGYFFDEALAPIQLTNGSWAYLGRDSQEPVTAAVYEATYDCTRDPETGAYTGEPLYAAHLQNGYAAVCRDGAWGLLDADGSEIIPCQEQGVAWEGTSLWIKDDAGWHMESLPD